MADRAARAALAAGKQGKFWEYHDRLFKTKKITARTFEKIANQLDLNTTQFWKDLKSDEISAHVKKDMAEAQRLGITGTPTIFINGRKLKERSLAGFQAMIDEELQKANQ